MVAIRPSLKTVSHPIPSKTSLRMHRVRGRRSPTLPAVLVASAASAVETTTLAASSTLTTSGASVAGHQMTILRNIAVLTGVARAAGGLCARRRRRVRRADRASRNEPTARSQTTPTATRTRSTRPSPPKTATLTNTNTSSSMELEVVLVEARGGTSLTHSPAQSAATHSIMSLTPSTSIQCLTA